MKEKKKKKQKKRKSKQNAQFGNQFFGIKHISKIRFDMQ